MVAGLVQLQGATSMSSYQQNPLFSGGVSSVDISATVSSTITTIAGKLFLYLEALNKGKYYNLAINCLVVTYLAV